MAVRRVAPPQAAPPPPPKSGGSVRFGDEGFFTGGGLGLPEGDYALTFTTQMFTPTKADGTPSRMGSMLAVMLTAYPIDRQGNLIGEPSEHPLTCGGNAHESFTPSADGKGFDAVPNGKSQGMWALGNFGIFWESLKQAQLPKGVVVDSFEPLDGIWVHTQNIPEPEQKRDAQKKARSKTGAAAMMGGGQPEEDRGPRMCIVVSEILEGGKPWEGTGGIPEGAEAPAPAAPPPPARGPVGVAARGRVAAPPPPAAAPAQSSDEDVSNAAMEAVASVLQASPQGITKLKLKTDAFSACKKASGDDMAQLVTETYLQSDDTLNIILGELGYGVAGLWVKPLE